MEELWKDLRFGTKLLWKDRTYLVATLLTLALCIGANTAIFSVIRSVLLRPLPFPHPDRLVTIYNSYPNAGYPRASNGVPDYYDRLDQTDVFASLAMYQSRGVTIGESGSPERVAALAVTPSFFQVIEVGAARGRTFTPEEGELGNQHKVVLTYGLWQQRFAGRTNVIGQDLRVDGIPYTIVGVMPRGFLFQDAGTRLFVPLAFTPQQKSDDARHSNSWEMFGRLKPGATVARAQAEIDALNRRNLDRFPQVKEVLINAGFHSVVVDFQSDLTRNVTRTLLLLQAGVLLVLLIGCVNVANLVLVRAGARAKELAMRSALGASRRRLVRQLLTENVLLAVIGGVVGLGLGLAGLQLVSALGADQLPRGSQIRMDGQVMGATLLLSVLAGILFGTIPVFRLLRGDLNSVFRQETRTGTSGRGALTTRGALVVAQVSMAFTLLIVAGLMIASFMRTLAVHPGFQPDHVLTASVSLPAARYPNPEDRTSFVNRALEEIRAIPGVNAAGMTSVIPFGSDYSSSVITPEGYVAKPGESPLSPIRSVVTPGYLNALGLQVVRGRAFNDGDTQSSLAVVIIDEWLAHRYWPDRNPIGLRLFQGVYGAIPEDSIRYQTIVGVVKSIRVMGLTGDQPEGHFYYPFAQHPAQGTMFITLRTAVDPTTITAAVQRAVTAIDPDLPVYAVQTMRQRIDASLITDRARMVLLLVFAGVALFLAAIGIYGVLAYAVSLRTREIGIRVALGSTNRAVFRMILSYGARLLVLGLAVGLGTSLLLTRLLRSMLFEVRPDDPAIFVGVILVLGAVAVLACAVPARRATRIDMVAALTHQ